jgi:hypothetical protein
MQANDLLRSLFLLTAFCSSCIGVSAQTKKGENVRVQTFDGNEFQGALLEDVGQKVILQTKMLGKVIIEQKKVQSIQLLEGSTAQPAMPAPPISTPSNPQNAWVLVESRDGNRFEGELLEETDKNIVLQTTMLGKITLDMKEVRSIRLLKESKSTMPAASVTPTATLHDGMTLVETQDENQFIGILDDSNPDKVVVDTRTMGKVSILRNKIRRIQPLTAAIIRTDELWMGNPNYHRNIMTPTAMPLRPHEGQVRNTDILFTAATYGMNKHWSAEVGFDLTSLLTISQPNLFYIMPQYHKQVGQKSYIAFGTFIGVHGETSRLVADTIFGTTTTIKTTVMDLVPFTTFTYGTTENNLTFGVGYRFVDGKLRQNPVVMVGGQYRLSRNWMFVGEVMNQKLSAGLRDPDNPEVLFPIINVGVRYLTRRYVFDFGISRSKTFNQVNIGGNTAPATTMGTRPVLSVAMPFYIRPK